MQEIDIANVRYQLGRVAHEFDSQTFVAEVEEHYGGELYAITFQRGYHTYVLEIDGEQLTHWFSAQEHSKDMNDMVEAVKLAVEELVT